MIRYVSNRLLLAIPTLIGVAIITFFVLRVLPGDIVEAKLRGDGAQVTVDVIERERARLGLDKPRSEQFVDWMKGLAKFDLGNSMWTGRPVHIELPRSNFARPFIQSTNCSERGLSSPSRARSRSITSTVTCAPSPRSFASTISPG